MAGAFQKVIQHRSVCIIVRFYNIQSVAFQRVYLQGRIGSSLGALL